MSGQQPEKTRERAPANLGIKFNPALGAANIKRFYATVRALLKSNEQSGELALAVLEGRANSSQESLVLFEPRAADYEKVLAEGSPPGGLPGPGAWVLSIHKTRAWSDKREPHGRLIRANRWALSV